MLETLKSAWRWRSERGLFAEASALRVFYGPGEGGGALSRIAIDRFGDHYWVTDWSEKSSPSVLKSITQFLKEEACAQSGVVLCRPAQGMPATDPTVLFGTPPEKIEVHEKNLKVWIRFLSVRHPGLFLDHAPLRAWLQARAKGWKVLNTFAYTGSLSIACGLGGAAHVTTLDLSKPIIRWAMDNWALNGFSEEHARFISGDVFEWLPRLQKQDQRFDCIILDPPSFSRGAKGRFSTAQDLERLHELAMNVLAPGGVLVTSINSANVSWEKFERDVLSAARKARLHFEVLWQIGLPETFPTPLGKPEERYLKGFVLRRLG